MKSRGHVRPPSRDLAAVFIKDASVQKKTHLHRPREGQLSSLVLIPQSFGVNSLCVPIIRSHFLPKCSSKLPGTDSPRPFFFCSSEGLSHRKNKSRLNVGRSACLSGAAASARLPAADLKHRPYHFLTVIRLLPGGGIAGSRLFTALTISIY